MGGTAYVRPVLCTPTINRKRNILLIIFAFSLCASVYLHIVRKYVILKNILIFRKTIHGSLIRLTHFITESIDLFVDLILHILHLFLRVR